VNNSTFHAAVVVVDGVFVVVPESFHSTGKCRGFCLIKRVYMEISKQAAAAATETT
jgi:hypothetical protein